MYVYGPVPSRRLGRSLGVSPIPAKVCSYTCVYCQLGRTNRLQVERESFFPRDTILSEIIEHARKTAPEYVTFVGDGEPTLCADLGWLIQETKTHIGAKTAVITNGSLLYRKDVRDDLCHADVVIPTLDAGDEAIFRMINRPHREITYDRMIQGLIDFRLVYTGELWIEVMLVKGLNDGDDSLGRIRKVIDTVRPDRVYVLAPIRPPAEHWVEPPVLKRILKAQSILGGAIPIVDRETGEFALENFSDARTALLEIGSRHPLRRDQAEEIARRLAGEKVVPELIASGDLIVTEFDGRQYLLPRHFRRSH
ncbi:MAG: radical SAM protein [candidate division Zixibacteria bacterium]|nr:radical SAM protein [candidate division Zixibacteria bacterium]